jgi:ABC-2 type transport system ATP-binding protein
MSQNIVEVTGLVKKYADFAAVDHISFSVKQGEVFGLLGPNGAGKTTTLECLEGLRRVSSGEIRVAGLDPQSQGTNLGSVLGVQLQLSALPDSIKVVESLQLFSAWHNTTVDQSLAKRFHIVELYGKTFKQLSAGQKRRLQLVLALVNHPKVIILDEPTAGLDVQNRAALHEEIRTLKALGLTVILATHDMAEAEELCDRIAILIKGRIAVCGTPQEVTAAGNRETRILLHTQANSLLPGETIGAARFIQAKDDYLEWKSRDVAAAVMQVLQRVQKNNDNVDDLRVERPSLEERFLELAEGK